MMKCKLKENERLKVENARTFRTKQADKHLDKGGQRNQRRKIKLPMTIVIECLNRK
jgi:hypothetical protein